MKTKTVYQYDHQGLYVGPAEADQSPLEPDVYLFPAGCVEAAPPKFNAATHMARWADEKWSLEKIPAPATPTLAQMIEAVIALRRSAYMRESDPLKNEADYDAIESGTEPDYSEWVAKVSEIKERFPIPAES